MGTPPAGARPASRARPSTTMRAERYAPLRRCLYCLCSGVPLTEEHLIPRALGGRLTLPDSVCEPCRRLTGRPEQATLDREFLVPKTLLALKRRRARGKGPGRMPAVTLVGDDKPSMLTADTFPRRFSLPALDPAGLPAGTDRTDILPTIGFVDCHLNLGTPTTQNIAAAPPLFEPRAYAYAIAKWAYALAVAQRGLDFRHAQAMRDLMLGRRADVFAFVRTPSSREQASTAWLHDFSLHERDESLAVRLALFASAGMTPFEVTFEPPAGTPVSARAAAAIVGP